MFCVYETESEHESSTEAELVGVDDILSKMLWTKLFIEAHGHKVNMNVIYCDNTRGGCIVKKPKACNASFCGVDTNNQFVVKN